MLTSVLVAAVSVGTVYVAQRMYSANRGTLSARAWVNTLTHEQAEVAREDRRCLMFEYSVDPRRFRSGEASQIREPAVAAKGRMNQLTGQPYGASFRAAYQKRFISECAAAARAIHDTGARS